MSLKNLIIIGAGGHAHSVIDVIESGNEYRVIGLVDSSKTAGDRVFDYEVLGAEDDLERLVREHVCDLFVAIGDNFHRYRVVQEIRSRIPNVKIATLLHYRAYVSKRAHIGQGAVVMAGAVVNAGCQIGDGVIVNTNAVIDHDCVIDRFASLAPNVSTGGAVCIGKRSSIGLGAKLIHNINIGHDVCVGAGTLLLKSVDNDCVVVYGTPSRVVRQRRKDESYL